MVLVIGFMAIINFLILVLTFSRGIFLFFTFRMSIFVLINIVLFIDFAHELELVLNLIIVSLLQLLVTVLILSENIFQL